MNCKKQLKFARRRGVNAQVGVGVAWVRQSSGMAEGWWMMWAVAVVESGVSRSALGAGGDDFKWRGSTVPTPTPPASKRSRGWRLRCVDIAPLLLVVTDAIASLHAIIWKADGAHGLTRCEEGANNTNTHLLTDFSLTDTSPTLVTTCPTLVASVHPVFFPPTQHRCGNFHSFPFFRHPVRLT